MVANGGPFSSAYDTDIFDRKNGEEEVLVGLVVPVLVQHCNMGFFGEC